MIRRLCTARATHAEGCRELGRAESRRSAGTAAALVVVAISLVLAGCSKSSSGASGSTTSTSAPTTSTSSSTTSVPTSTTSPVPPAVEKIYTAMLAKVGTAASVHFVATSVGTQPGQPSTHLRYVADTGVSDGSQVATWSGSDQTGSFTIVAIGSTTYMKADANSLVTFFNAMPAETASKYAGKWLSFTSSDKLYASLRNDITLASVAASLEFLPAGVKTTSSTIVMTGKPIPSTSTPAGERATATTTISSHTKLPLSQSFSASYKGATEKSSILFSQWGAATIPSAPRGAIAYDSITVTTPTT